MAQNEANLKQFTDNSRKILLFHEGPNEGEKTIDHVGKALQQLCKFHAACDAVSISAYQASQKSGHCGAHVDTAGHAAIFKQFVDTIRNQTENESTN